MSITVALGIWVAGLFAVLSENANFDIAPPHKQLLASTERSFQIQPKAIRIGQSAVLSWFNKYSSEILLYEDAETRGHWCVGSLRLIGRFPSTGSIEVSPRSSTIYVVSCADIGITCAESISLTVR